MKNKNSSDEDLKKYTRLISRVPDFERRVTDIANKYALEQKLKPQQRVPWKKLVNNQFPNTFENTDQGRADWLWLVNTHRSFIRNRENELKSKLNDTKQKETKPTTTNGYNKHEIPLLPEVKKPEVEFVPIEKQKINVTQQKLF